MTTKIYRYQKPAAKEAYGDWSLRTHRSKGRGRTVIASNQTILTAKGVITGNITATGGVSGHKGLKVYKASNNCFYIQKGLNVLDGMEATFNR